MAVELRGRLNANKTLPNDNNSLRRMSHPMPAEAVFDPIEVYANLKAGIHRTAGHGEVGFIQTAACWSDLYLPSEF